MSAPHPVYPPIFFPVQANVSKFKNFKLQIYSFIFRCHLFQWLVPI
jgi:hypothetical protein